MSAKIADRLEQVLKGVRINGYVISVLASDMPERGRGALEKKSGVDLYVAIRVRERQTGVEIAKGILIQGKLDKPSSRTEQDRLLEQCLRMTARSSKGSYVWVYGSGGVVSLPASEVLTHPNVPPQALSGRNVAEQFRDVLDCVAGDEALVQVAIFDDVQALNNMMREIAARDAIAIDVLPSEFEGP